LHEATISTLIIVSKVSNLVESSLVLSPKALTQYLDLILSSKAGLRGLVFDSPTNDAASNLA